MPTKLFITGITGYIGGDAFYTLAHAHRDFEYAALIRSEEKAKRVREKYPNVRTVIGGLDDSDIISRESAWADIVLHTADSSDHVGAANAIARGMIEGHSAERPGYWLHTGGTGILTYFDSEVKKVHGEKDDKVFDDDEGVEELTHLPAEAFHRNVDEIVLKVGVEHADKVKTVIVCPPTIYGHGRGTSTSRGRQVYELANFILEQRYVPVIGKGLARWNNVHVHDLSQLFGTLVRAAIKGSQNTEVWGAKGYFLCENGEHVWGDLARRVGEQAFALKLLSQNPEVKELSLDEAIKSPAGFEAASWGWNSRGKALRARKVLGWKPCEGSLEDEVPDILKYEVERLKK